MWTVPGKGRWSATGAAWRWRKGILTLAPVLCLRATAASSTTIAWHRVPHNWYLKSISRNRTGGVRRTDVWRPQAFTFDQVYDSESAQADVYKHTVQPLLDSFFQGINVTIFAYGQTGSGKTHTMGTNDGKVAGVSLLFSQSYSHTLLVCVCVHLCMRLLKLGSEWCGGIWVSGE
jgi:hypothetical protein